MSEGSSFDRRSTADQVLAGVDLSGRHVVVTGCTSGIGFETMNALAANGARVTAIGRTLSSAMSACRRSWPGCTPLACDLSDLSSINAAVGAMQAAGLPIDAIVANAGIGVSPRLETRYGVDLRFWVNHLAHVALINGVSDLIKDGTGRIVIVSDDMRTARAPGIRFEDLDGAHSYEPNAFYGQSKFAAALYAVELSRRLAPRGIAVNSVDPGATRGTAIHRHRHWSAARFLTQPWMKSPAQGAATSALLAASPRVNGVSGQHWKNCGIIAAHPLLQNRELANQVWTVSMERLAAAAATVPLKGELQEAA